MLLQVQKEHIIEGLQKAASIIPAKSGAAYLRSLWLKAEGDSLTVMATDANIEFTGRYDAKVSDPGMVGVNGRNFVDLVRRLPEGELRLRLDDKSGAFVVEQGRRNYRLPVSDVTWFQPLASFPGDKAVVWSGDFFQEALDKTLFCVSDDEASDALSCLYMRPNGKAQGGIDICGLNGHQFALITFTHDDLAAHLPEEGILLQKKYVGELRKWLGEDEIELDFTDKRLFVRTGNGKECISLPRAGYVYPDYNAFLSRLETPEASVLSIDRKECLNALDRIAIFNTDIDRCTCFDLSETELLLSAQGQDTGSAAEPLEVSYTGTIGRIIFPTRNMMDILTHYQSQQLSLTLTGEEGPCGIAGENDPGYTVLLMPMKMAQQDYYSEGSEDSQQ